MELSIPTVQPGCAESVLSSNFKCRQVIHKKEVVIKSNDFEMEPSDNTNLESLLLFCFFNNTSVNKEA